MTLNQLPAITSVPHLSTAERAAILDRLFEPCVPLHTLSVSLLLEKTFDSYDDLISSIGVQLTGLADSSSTSDSEWLQSILAAHPRLGQSNVESSQSRAEQAQLSTGGDISEQTLSELNDLYERTFPGLRYVYERQGRSWGSRLTHPCRVFVNGRSRSLIMEDMKTRIERRDLAAERYAAIKVCLLIFSLKKGN